MSQETNIPVPGQISARSEEVQRTSSPTSTDFSTSSTMSSPPSRRLKRTNDEVYRTTTGAPSGHSKNMSINERPRTAPEQKQKTLQPSSFEQNGFPKDIFGQTVKSFSSTSGTLGGQPSSISTAPAAADMQQTFVARVQELQAQFDHEYDQYEQDLENRDHKAHIEPYDWENLESRYLEEMEPAIRDEQEIQNTIAERYRVRLSSIAYGAC